MGALYSLLLWTFEILQIELFENKGAGERERHPPPSLGLTHAPALAPSLASKV